MRFVLDAQRWGRTARRRENLKDLYRADAVAFACGFSGNRRGATVHGPTTRGLAATLILHFRSEAIGRRFLKGAHGRDRV